MKKILSLIIMTTVVFSCFAQKPKTTIKYRRADTGRYTTKEYNSKNPKTTIKETKKKK
ncbi:hypothetical protein SF1_21810 [Sphingobacterium faecium NBRC 15299]|uniref:hypothetical protein n=1 Tax=Sphingobacterium faecium TaxID=34087 RepID=UPI000D4E5D72|nr:hypothetical protein [Sphingobacterium faecium]PTX14120.1 hypothetical protein C8N37_101879 [Sphingobacterium faecium]GEM64199.1 hypothetical protein SF1_21810 [Sphingobacterium faecium NBRC 15299]